MRTSLMVLAAEQKLCEAAFAVVALLDVREQIPNLPLQYCPISSDPLWAAVNFARRFFFLTSPSFGIRNGQTNRSLICHQSLLQAGTEFLAIQIQHCFVSMLEMRIHVFDFAWS